MGPRTRPSLSRAAISLAKTSCGRREAEHRRRHCLNTRHREWRAEEAGGQYQAALPLPLPRPAEAIGLVLEARKKFSGQYTASTALMAGFAGLINSHKVFGARLRAIISMPRGRPTS